MTEQTIKELWQYSNEQLEQSILISRKNTADITALKVQSLLSSMKPLKIFTLIVGGLWVVFGSLILIALCIHAYQNISLFFLISAGIQVLLTAAALVIYLYQLILIYQVDIGDSVVATQEKLARLRSSTLLVARILFLQLPVWTTFFLNKSMFVPENTILLIFNGIITLASTACAVWLFYNIRYENRDKKWFKLMFNGKDWNPVIQSMELLEEIADFKKGV